LVQMHQQSTGGWCSVKIDECWWSCQMSRMK
jgi:hypothetical protein